MNRLGIDFPETKGTHSLNMTYFSAIRTFHEFDLYLCQGSFTPADGGIIYFQSSDSFRISFNYVVDESFLSWSLWVSETISSGMNPDSPSS